MRLKESTENAKPVPMTLTCSTCNRQFRARIGLASPTHEPTHTNLFKKIMIMPLTELDNDSESVWVKLFVNKKTHFVASWYRPPVDGHLPVSDNGNDLLNSLEKFDNLFREQLDKIKNIDKGNKPPLIHI